MPLMHGAQGCTAFGKVFFVRHFREPIPLQTTAMDQISSVMGADENIVEGLQAVCGKHKPEPGRTADDRPGRDAGGRHPRRRQGSSASAIRSSTASASSRSTRPTTRGCFESGYAAAVRELIEVLVPENRGRPSGRPCGAAVGSTSWPGRC